VVEWKPDRLAIVTAERIKDGSAVLYILRMFDRLRTGFHYQPMLPRARSVRDPLRLCPGCGAGERIGSVSVRPAGGRFVVKPEGG
jgi:hypothetical protein